MLTPALSSAAAISSSDAVFADTVVALPDEPLPFDEPVLLVGAAAGALPFVVVEPPHAARARASTAAVQVQANRWLFFMHGA